MRPTSIQIQSVMDAFGKQAWQFEHLEGKDVIRTVFEAYHTQVHLHAQAFPQINALSIVGEAPLSVEMEHEPLILELFARANKKRLTTRLLPLAPVRIFYVPPALLEGDRGKTSITDVRLGLLQSNPARTVEDDC